MSEAKRFNEGKPSLSYILQFVKPIEALARIMELGAIKYDDGNWRKGGKPDSEYLNSMMRHLTEWIHGDVYDKDSGCSHLGHAIWNMLALHELNHPDEIMDDELFKERCAYWKAKKEEKAEKTLEVKKTRRTAGARKWLKDSEYRTLSAVGNKGECPTIEKMGEVLKAGFMEGNCDDKVPNMLQSGSVINKDKAGKYMKELVSMNDENPSLSDADLDAKDKILVDGLADIVAETTVAPADYFVKDVPHPVFCACDVCMDGPRKMEFKNTWGLPAIEVFNEAGEKRAEEICGIKLADVSEEVKIENLLKGAPVTVNFVGSGIREKGYSLPGYQTLGVVSSVNTFDTLATLPPMSEDELVDALYTNEDMHSRAKGELAIKKARRKALAESEAEITFSIRDLQQCESFLELKRKYILPALHKQAESCTLEWIRAHDSYYQHLMDVDRTETLKEDAAEKETS
jgi:hypothetical protein